MENFNTFHAVIIFGALLLSEMQNVKTTASDINNVDQPRCNVSDDNKVVICSHLQLTSLPNVTNPDEVNTLLLDHNNLSWIRKFEFARFRTLTHLDLSYNDINSIEDDGFQNMSSLGFLSLAHSIMEPSVLTSQVFRGLANLKTLKLNNNNMAEYPNEALSQLTSLEALFINGVPDGEFGEGFRNLTKLTHLTISGNNGFCNQTTLSNSTFVNTVFLENLDVSKCYVSHIEKDSFSPLTKLRSLNISDNVRLGFQSFGNGAYGLQFTNITTLIANKIVVKHTSCVVIRKAYVVHLSNTSLENLYLDDNEIENIENGVLQLLPSTLRLVSAQRNKFSYGHYLRDLDSLTGLEKVWLSGKSYPIVVPNVDTLDDYMDDQFEAPYCFHDETDERDVLASELQSRSVWYEPETVRDPPQSPFNLSLPPNLQRIVSNFTQMAFPIGKIHFQTSNLSYLDLSSNLVLFDEGTIRGLDNVTYIDLSNNLARKMSTSLLENCLKLRTLNISFNFFGWQIQKDTKGEIFKNLTQLTKLVISNNDMKYMRGEVLRDLHSLKILNVSDNGMYSFKPNIRNSIHLEVIDCSYNQIKWMPNHIMDDINEIKSKVPNLTLHLRGNPLSCSCNQLPFLKWLLTSGITPDDMADYYCLMPNTHRRVILNKADFKKLIDEQTTACQNNFGLALGCASIVVASITLMISAILYRYRWKLRYLYYAARLRYIRDTDVEEEQDEFLFDAFVSYADEDRGFVINDMRAHLEHDTGMTLNIHHRDFMPGEPIASNIVGAIKKSRKTLVVLSQNFLNSYWCTYELRMAQMESISSGRDLILIIMYESVPAKNIPPEFLHMLQSDSYIEYPRDEGDSDIFWKQVARALRHRSHRQNSTSSSLQAVP
ncbi:toll-like receptor 4 isoform X2 [Haliotis rubra]|uniref:toll-like receptor 4 isoform X1 n=1 Tax=Haliotis rubra TaxID=36100 RepID=UPI001EE607A0|nr:toll-like receptor 4 isoform X1 [Haliotis rubra]XP_046550053.1 toll-like receptor 4 isoform X2 [Haliotis rubra]